MEWPRLFEFLVSAQGRRITYRSLNGSARKTFHTSPYLLTQMLSFALLHQGVEPLHATTVVVQGRALVFLGDSGYGKSSLAAAVLQAGHTLLTDDLLVIKPSGCTFIAYPGPPQIKLYPHVADMFLGGQAVGTPMAPHTTKLIIPLEPRHRMEVPQPVGAMYVLRPRGSGSRTNRITIRALSPRRAALDIIANTFNPALKERDRLARQFHLATRLAAHFPIKSLSYPRNLRQLPAVVEALQTDLGT